MDGRAEYFFMDTSQNVVALEDIWRIHWEENYFQEILCKGGASAVFPKQSRIKVSLMEKMVYISQHPLL